MLIFMEYGAKWSENEGKTALFGEFLTDIIQFHAI